MQENKKTALITGATSGIGEAVAEIFAENNINLIICGRREEKLNILKNKLKNKTDVFVLPFDLLDKNSIKQAIETIKLNNLKIDILINNAGGAKGLAPFHENKLDDLFEMIQLNFSGLVQLTHFISSEMVKNHEGTILNVSSIAGKEAYPNGHVYCAVKHAIEGLTKSLRMDLFTKNIKVMSVAPGMVETEFSINRFFGDVEKAKKVYENMTPLSAKDIAETVYFMISRPDHVVIADVTIFPKQQASVQNVFRKN